MKLFHRQLMFERYMNEKNVSNCVAQLTNVRIFVLSKRHKRT